MRKKIVLDTNVVISALFWKGSPREVYEKVKNGEVELLSSLDIEILTSKEFLEKGK